MTNLDESPNYISSIVSIEQLSNDKPGTVNVGTEWKETRVIFGRKETETLRVTEVTSPDSESERSFTVQSNACGALFTSVAKVEAIEGHCKLSMSCSSEPPQGFLLRLWSRALMAVMGGMLKRSMMKMMLGDLDDISRVSEDSLNKDQDAIQIAPQP